jgi:hypothetical protein
MLLWGILCVLWDLLCVLNMFISLSQVYRQQGSYTSIDQGGIYAPGNLERFDEIMKARGPPKKEDVKLLAWKKHSWAWGAKAELERLSYRSEEDAEQLVLSLRRKIQRMNPKDADNAPTEEPEPEGVEVHDEAGYSIFLAQPKLPTMEVEMRLIISRAQHEKLRGHVLRTNPKDFDAEEGGRQGRKQQGSGTLELRLKEAVSDFVNHLAGQEALCTVAKIMKQLKVSPGCVTCMCRKKVPAHVGSGKISKADAHICHVATCVAFTSRLSGLMGIERAEIESRIDALRKKRKPNKEAQSGAGAPSTPQSSSSSSSTSSLAPSAPQSSSSSSSSPEPNKRRQFLLTFGRKRSREEQEKEEQEKEGQEGGERRIMAS